MKMGYGLILGAAIIAAAILFVFRYTVATGPGATAFLLDRWTGSVDACIPVTNVHLACGESKK
jgi:hypothetical protein